MTQRGTASILVVACITLVGSCASDDFSSGPDADGGSIVGSAYCIDFEDQTDGTRFDLGATFSASGMPIGVSAMQWSNGSSSSSGSVRIDHRGYALGSGLDANLRNSLASLGWTDPVDWIALRFGELGGNVNLRVNSDFRNTADLAELNGAVIGGSQVFVAASQSNGNWFGDILISGPISDFAIGGQELWIDDVCFQSDQQSPSLSWARSYGESSRDTGWAITASTGGGYLLAGQSRVADGTSRAWVSKLGPSGALAWQYTYGATHFLDGQAQIFELPGGEILLAHNGSGGVNLLKLNASGTVIWGKSYDLGSNVSMESMSVGSSGEVFLGGSIAPANLSDFWADAWVMKLGSDGGVNWAKRLGTPPGIEIIYGLVATADGGCAAAGRGPDSYGWTLKMSAGGSVEWQREFPHTVAEAYPFDIRNTTDGGYWTMGRLRAADGSSRAWLAKQDGGGQYQWIRSYGESLYTIATSSVVEANGDLVIGGAVSADGQSVDFAMFRVDPLGAIVWQRRFGGTGPEFAEAICAAGDGGFAMTGYTGSFGAGDLDAWVIKTSSQGTIDSPCPSSAPINLSPMDHTWSSVVTSVTPVDLPHTVTDLSITLDSAQATVAQQCPLGGTP